MREFIIIFQKIVNRFDKLVTFVKLASKGRRKSR